jgi:hypothetical protein
MSDLMVFVSALVLGYGQLLVVGLNDKRSDRALAISCAIGIVIVESAFLYAACFSPNQLIR